MSLPADLQTIVDQISDLEKRADEITAGLSEEEFQWQPDGGRRWSVAQCLDHLAIGAEVYLATIRPVVDAARQRGVPRRGPAKPGFFGQKFVNSLEPPVKMRGRAPNKILPRPKRTRDEIMTAFHESHAAFRQLVADCAELDTNNVTFTNPFLTFVKMRVSTAMHVIPAHGRRHLCQAENVVASLRSVSV
jgi:DinB superfamily